MATPIIKSFKTDNGDAKYDYESLANKPTAATTAKDGLMSASDKTNLNTLVDDYQRVLNLL